MSLPAPPQEPEQSAPTLRVGYNALLNRAARHFEKALAAMEEAAAMEKGSRLIQGNLNMAMYRAKDGLEYLKIARP